MTQTLEELKKRYDDAKTWQEKAIIMEIYFYWGGVKSTVRATALFFDTSVGLVSENLRIARCSHADESLLKHETRELALKKCERRKFPRIDLGD